MNFASYASFPEQSKGRLFEENESPHRSTFQRDRDRIIHSRAFRRLQYKTQVFVCHEGDHYRSRLTHSLEVAQITRSLCRVFEVNEDLAEGIALAHDLGHTPFGHAGEYALDEVMHEYGGFDHNAQTFRILTELEAIYARFKGLNLTWESLEGVMKHNGPIDPKVSSKHLNHVVDDFNAHFNLETNTYASMEAQISAIADDIAYDNHDVDDGVRAGLFSLEDLMHIPFIADAILDVKKGYNDLSKNQMGYEVFRRMVDCMVRDVIQESKIRIRDLNPKTVDDIRHANHQLIALSENLYKQRLELKKFLFENMYYHYKLKRMTKRAKNTIRDLFSYFMEDYKCLPTEWREQVEQGYDQPRVIADYIAGMTDRFALNEHKALFH